MTENTANKVFINDDNVIEIQVVGDQTRDTVLAMGAEIERLLGELKGHGQSALVLDDVTRLGKTDTAARQTVSQLAKTMPYRKLAMLGASNPLMRIGTGLLLQAIGMGKKIKYFEDRVKATQWLLS